MIEKLLIKLIIIPLEPIKTEVDEYISVRMIYFKIDLKNINKNRVDEKVQLKLSSITLNIFGNSII